MTETNPLKQELLSCLFDNATKLRELSYKLAGSCVCSILTSVSDTVAKVYNLIDSLQQIATNGISQLLFAVVDLLNQTMSIILFV